MAFLLFVACSLPYLCSSVLDDSLVEYYVNLIQSEINRSENFVLPTDSQKDKPSTTDEIEYGVFDHIVIGAGSAGAVVASRLSEDSFRDVLLLEAGGPATNFSEIPGMASNLVGLEYNWNYYTVPQTTSCLDNPERRCYYARGKMLGGTSGINYLLYIRGSRKDYDKWCAEGNPGWCYKDVLPFFKKSENSKLQINSDYHGTGGTLSVDYVKPMNKPQQAFIKANQQLGRAPLDYNGLRQEGIGIPQSNIKNGRRSSTQDFLKAASGRSNLKILTNSHVTRILIQPDTKRAIGVVFARNNKYYVAKSRLDIVLSAGTIGSPQLLMLSGVGPKLHLDSLRIPVINDLSVGENLQDHVGFSLYFQTNYSKRSKSLKEKVKDYLNGIGELTDASKLNSLVFLRTNLTKKDDFSDIEILFSGNSVTPLFTDVNSNERNQFEHRERIFMLLIILLHPKSRGYVQLKSADPFDYPIIDPKLLYDPSFKDIETLYQGSQLGLQLLETKPFKQLGVRLMSIDLPACKEFDFMSKEYWYCYIRQLSTPTAHLTGTCKMGPDPLQGAVVDHQLKVHGIQNLRVADASIIPLSPAAHVNAPAIMVGEKAAHMIRYN